MILAGTERLAAILGAGDIDAAPRVDAGAIDRLKASDTPWLLRYMVLPL